jgi:hypothetical protein
MLKKESKNVSGLKRHVRNNAKHSMGIFIPKVYKGSSFRASGRINCPDELTDAQCLR